MTAKRAGDQLLDLSKDLKATADGKVLLKELLKRLRVLAKTEITPASRRVALAKLPAGGGLNKRVAKSPQRITSRAGGTTATVAVTVPGKSKGSGAAAADRGEVRHPLFGNRESWHVTKVPARWFSDTAEKAAPKVLAEALDAIEATAKEAGFR